VRGDCACARICLGYVYEESEIYDMYICEDGEIQMYIYIDCDTHTAPQTALVALHAETGVYVYVDHGTYE